VKTSPFASPIGHLHRTRGAEFASTEPLDAGPELNNGFGRCTCLLDLIDCYASLLQLLELRRKKVIEPWTVQNLRLVGTTPRRAPHHRTWDSAWIKSDWGLGSDFNPLPQHYVVRSPRLYRQDKNRADPVVHVFRLSNTVSVHAPTFRTCIVSISISRKNSLDDFRRIGRWQRRRHLNSQGWDAVNQFDAKTWTNSNLNHAREANGIEPKVCRFPFGAPMRIWGWVMVV
jgi:hypothetical protein